MTLRAIWNFFLAPRRQPWIQLEVVFQKRSNRSQIIDFFFGLCDLEISRMTSKNNRVPYLCHFKLSTQSRNHLRIQTGVIFRKRSFEVTIGNFLYRVTLEFDGWPWKIVGHIFHATSNFVHHFVVICEFKLELRSGNVQIGTKFVLTSVTLTFDPRPSPFAWTSFCQWQWLLKISWWHNEGIIVKKLSQTDRRQDRS